MKRIGVIYRSVTGNTQYAAEALRRELGENVVLADVNDVDGLNLDDFDLVILGTPTWNIGEIIEWNKFFEKLDRADKNKIKFALFGLGDQLEHGDQFLNGMGALYDRLHSKGVTIIGQWPTDGYSYDDSLAVVEGKFVGLALDQDNQSDQTPPRIHNWVSQLQANL
jgi:flavodoxin I